MTTIRVTPDGLAAAFQARGRATREAVVKGLRIGAHEGRKIVIKRTPVDEGIMRAGWFVHLVPSGAKLANSVPHAGLVEGGSRPHRPPFDAIRDWVWRNRKKFGIRGTGKKAKAKADGMAHAVCEKIAKQGTKPRWVVKGALPRLARIAKKAVEVEIRRHA